MKTLFLFAFSSFFFLMTAISQDKGYVTGQVNDRNTGQPLPGAHIFIKDGKGTLALASGEYLLELETGIYDLNAHFVGYKSASGRIEVVAGDTVHLDFSLSQNVELLDEVVVTAEKTEQRITDVNVSMALIKPEEIEKINSTSLDQALVRVPGFEILDGQPSIRGGSGFSYGAGSRVLVLVDGLPMITADAGHVQWSFLPLENLSQVEIIKGASSVLYGSSALNGVVNLRYKDPVDKPSTSIRLFSGAYLKPARKELVWWDSPRWYAGGSASHSRKAGNLDVTADTYLYNDQGYREDEFDKLARMNVRLRYRAKKISGLTYGLNTGGMITSQGDFFLWENADSGAYRQNPSGTSTLNANRFYIDPSVKYFTSKGHRHSLHARFYRNVNEMPDNEDKNSSFNLLIAEYQYLHKLSENVNWTIGSSANLSEVTSNLYGHHTKSEAAVFTQLSATLLSRLKYNLGFRWETYRLNDTRENSRPVFRTGLNYQLFEQTFLRLSFGQGYRFPSIAEKYTATQVGALNIFPNPDVESESAWSADAGIIQAFKIGSFLGYVDISAFRSEYTNMIEYTFGFYPPDSLTPPTIRDVGFKALNVGKARITGAETILGIEKSFGEFRVSGMGGYTYIYPIDLSIEKDSLNSNILKYRHRHSVKGDLNLEWRMLAAGATIIHNSFMERVDAVFIDPFFGNLLLPGYPDYRKEHQKGYTTVDTRISYRFARESSLALICKNLFNVEYIGRPGDIRPHRNISLQLLLKF
jgi:iron complex outermembrane receptor protein